MKKTLNIEERKVRMVKVKKPRFDMGGVIDNPTMTKTGKWLSAIGWVPSKESFATIKQWRERLSASTMVDVDDRNPITSDDPMFSSSTWQ